jgi:hypothetical protein
MQTSAQRPMGITILAVLAIIGGLFGLLAGCGALGIGSFAAGTGVSGGGSLLILGVITLINSILLLAFGVGAWTLQPWAWLLGVISQGISVVLGLWNIVTGNAGGGIISIIIAGVIVYYLMTPEVKRAFGRP